MAIDSVYFWLGTGGMGLGTAAFLWAFVTDARNRTYHAILAAIAGIAFLAYVAMSLRIGTVTVAGDTVDLARYVQWILATPLIVVYLGLLAGISRRFLGGLVVLDVLVMVAGLAGALTTGAAKWGSFLLGSVVYVVLLYGLLGAIREAVADRPAPVRSLFAKLRNLTVVIWTFYPLVWLLGPPGLDLVSYEIEVLVITYADLIAKVGFGVIALNSQRALSNLPQLDALRIVEGSAE